jgi:DNA helicase HerA-like ATPase
MPPTSPQTLSIDQEEEKGAIEGALRGLHALELPIAIDVDITAKGGRSLSMTVPHRGLQLLQRFLFPIYRGWSWTERSHAPPHASWKRGMVAEVRPVAWHAEGPYPRLVPREVLKWSPWEGFLRLPPQKGWNAWMRMQFSPWGPSTTQYLPQAEDPDARSPPHTIGRRLLDQRTERAVDLCWETRGVLLLWPDDGMVPDDAGQRVLPSMHFLSSRTVPRCVPQEWSPRSMTRLLEALSACPGGHGFTLKWIRTSWGRERLISSYLSSVGLVHSRVILSPRAYLSPSEVGAWLPSVAMRDPWLLSSAGSSGPSLLIGHDLLGTPVHLPWSQKEGHHLLVAGETGMGKSTLLVELAKQALDGKTSLIVFDPLGETARDVLLGLPRESLERSIWVSPNLSPIGLNALAQPKGLGPDKASVGRERLVGELVTAFRRVRAERYGETVYWGPRIEDLLTRVFLFLSYWPEATLEDAHDILTDPKGAHLPFESEPEKSRQMHELLEALQRERPEEMEGARRVVSEVTHSTSLSRLLSCRSPRWDLSRALEPGSVTLFSMERAESGGRAASYLGSILLSLVWSHMVARGNRGGKVVLVLDEVQEYANDSLAEMLRLGRRYNLHVWAATQSLTGLSPDLRDSLLTNARDLILFRGSPSDAKLASDHLGLPGEGDLLALPRGRARAFLGKASSVMAVNIPWRPISADELEERKNRAMSKVLENSREFWAKDALPRHSDEQVQPRAAVQNQPTSGSGEGKVDMDDLLAALLAGSLEHPEGEPFVVPLKRIEKMVVGDQRTLRRLGSILKGRGALVRAEKFEGERMWVLTREGLQEAYPPPWPPERLAAGREIWLNSAIQ